MTRILALFLALVVAVPAGADVSDLGAVFDEDFRDQCDTGSCHAFASVALLEAAMRRRRRDSEPVYLSDADLFLRTNVINGAVVSFYRDDPNQIERMLVEGGRPSWDLKVALIEGVARAETVPWDEFLVKFRRYRKARVTEAPLPPGVSRAARDIEFFYGLEDPEASQKRFDALKLERLEVRRMLAGFTVHASTFASRPDLPPSEPVRCLDAGRAVEARLMEDLVVRRPVIICLSLGGLPEWGSPPSPANHCVAIRGYRKPRGKAMSLLVRNSWGDDRHPDVPAHRFCRIHEVISLRP